MNYTTPARLCASRAGVRETKKNKWNSCNKNQSERREGAARGAGRSASPGEDALPLQPCTRTHWNLMHIYWYTLVQSNLVKASKIPSLINEWSAIFDVECEWKFIHRIPALERCRCRPAPRGGRAPTGEARGRVAFVFISLARKKMSTRPLCTSSTCATQRRAGCAGGAGERATAGFTFICDIPASPEGHGAGERPVACRRPGEWRPAAAHRPTCH